MRSDLHVVSAYKLPSQPYAAAAAVEAMVALPVHDVEVRDQVEQMLAMRARALEHEGVQRPHRSHEVRSVTALVD